MRFAVFHVSSTRRQTMKVAALLLMTAAGCSQSDAPPDEKLVPVAGSVRFGGQPTGGVRVLFTPTGSTGGAGAFALTEADGTFKLIHNRSQKPGIPAGEYIVQFSRFLMPDGSPIPPDKSPFASGGRESIPPAWSDLGRAGMHNTVTVTPDGGKPFDFAIPAQ